MTDLAAPSRDELEEQRTFLLASLDDLDGEWAADDIGADDYAALKADYTARLAAVLRTLDRIDGKLAAPVRAGSRPVGAARRRWPVLVAAALTVVVALGAGVLVTRQSGERLPGDPATGSLPESAGSPMADATRDVSALVEQAQLAASNGDVLNAVKLYDAALAKDPGNVVAITYKAWLLAITTPQLLSRSQELLDRAVALDPTYADAHAFRGLVLTRNKRPGEGVCELRTYLAITPPEDPLIPRVEAALEEALRLAGTEPDCKPSPIQPGPGLPGAPTTTTGATTP